MKGKFITLEGIDGVGKTTQLELLKIFAHEKAKDNWIFTRNPGGTELGIKLREILLNDQSLRVVPLAETLLYIADRAEHISKFVIPALEEDKIIICDRFIDSTVAYQGYGRELNIANIHKLNEIAIQGIKPDLTILFDADPSISFQRAKSRGQSGDKIEAEGLEFQKKIRAGFLEIAQLEPERFCIIDVAKKNPSEIHENVLKEIEKIIN